ncbi:hypothetical protein G7046_g7483 [Stylonectria norvegica]|nr:hypothetical protein G7046_g7483 [Stylonectria norvegica]
MGPGPPPKPPVLSRSRAIVPVAGATARQRPTNAIARREPASSSLFLFDLQSCFLSLGSAIPSLLDTQFSLLRFPVKVVAQFPLGPAFFVSLSFGVNKPATIRVHHHQHHCNSTTTGATPLSPLQLHHHITPTTTMESLLSMAFDNLSSYDGPKVRKGLRQVEGLLAQICLSNDRSHRGRDDVEASPPRKDLTQLPQDPAFREFFKLQEGFEWNVATRLIGTLDRLMAKGSDGQNDLLILSALDLIQGTLLLHPPSKLLFAREQNMNLLLDLLEPVNCPAIQSATLLTLVTALIDTPRNTRTFEDLDGLLTVTSLFKSRSTAREVKLKLVEFLYFYLMPETPSIPRADQHDSVPAMLQRSPSKLASAFSADSKRKRVASGVQTLTTEEKQELLSQYLSSVDDLVKDLRNCAPFGGVVC